MIRSLTSLRFVAAFMVFLHHTDLSIYGFGEWGVTFFFVLSGFILTYRYHELFANGIRGKDLYDFYSSRFARIYPVFILTFLFSLGLIHYDVFSWDLNAAIANIFLVQSLYSHYAMTYNGTAWSISTEAIFYTFFPVFLMITSKILGCRGKNSRSMIIGLFIMLLIIPFCVVTFIVDTKPAFGWKWWLIYVSPYRIFDFSMGMALAFLYFKVKDNLKGSIFYFTTLEIGSILLVILSFKFKLVNVNAADFSFNYLPSISLFVFIFTFQKGWISKFLMNKILVFLGEISFSFYMVHALVIKYLAIWFDPFDPREYRLLVLLIIIAISSIIYLAYEKPMRNLIKAASKKLIRNKATVPVMPANNKAI